MAPPSSFAFGFPGTPDPNEPFRSPRRMAKVLTGVYVLELVATVFLAVLLLRLLGLLRALEGGSPISQESWLSLATRIEDLQMTLLGLCLVGTVGLAVWTYRATANAAALGGTVSHSPGWAAVSYFIPVVNWWRPYVAIAEAWDAGAPAGGEPQGPGARRLLGAWWAAFLLSGWANFLRDRPGASTDPSGLAGNVTTSLIVLTVQLVATALTLAVIHGISRRHQERFATRIPKATVV